MDLKRKLRDKDKLVFGKEVVIKLVRKGEVDEIIVSSNSVHKDELLLMKDSFGVKVELISENSDELGALCKKPFSISVLGLRK